MCGMHEQPKLREGSGDEMQVNCPNLLGLSKPNSVPVEIVHSVIFAQEDVT